MTINGAIHDYDFEPLRLSMIRHFPPAFSQTDDCLTTDFSFSFGGFFGVSWLRLSEAKKLRAEWPDSSSCDDCLIAVDGAKVRGLSWAHCSNLPYSTFY